ncbi:hypothetical protein [Leuconostoc pseudomesenteroides]|jgi:hypothetical protein|uniref:hypothetical protein n=1 Tax=Leuconostoc pseudomesenteroides TaxID=33968 RepID=UPI0011DC90C3|nr:hypothetical protein [Leuconostoc pseudomesenteroides]MBS0958089.1 hypothetical protein [Leuconostoc pseudomesenteroides]MCT4379494.1 hypothetical protein [Leuconostoc pseudomesenteroides]MCT4413924.1 hypothetical protein [Leuconostoc pseudomesenteroides]
MKKMKSIIICLSSVLVGCFVEPASHIGANEASRYNLYQNANDVNSKDKNVFKDDNGNYLKINSVHTASTDEEPVISKISFSDNQSMEMHEEGILTTVGGVQILKNQGSGSFVQLSKRPTEDHFEKNCAFWSWQHTVDVYNWCKTTDKQTSGTINIGPIGLTISINKLLNSDLESDADRATNLGFGLGYNYNSIVNDWYLNDSYPHQNEACHVSFCGDYYNFANCNSCCDHSGVNRWGKDRRGYPLAMKQDFWGWVVMRL